MTDQMIKCPQCGTEIPISEALATQMKQELSQEIEAKYRKKSQEEIERLSTEARTKATESVIVELEDLRNQVKEKSDKLKAAVDAELLLRKEKRDLEDARENLQLELQRKLDEGRESIKKETAKSLSEQYDLKIAEYEHKIKGMSDQIDALKQRADQGSQQAQGEVLEIQLEELLTAKFLTDTISPVPKGKTGADVIQGVMDDKGRLCGSIIWESKRTKNWSDGWIDKLKEDQRAAKADVAIIVSTALPKDIDNFGHVNGVWVTDFGTLLPIAVTLRQGLIALADSRLSAVGKNQKMEMLYSYLSGTEFRGRIESIIEAFKSLKRDLDSEKLAMQKLWAQREKQIQRVTDNTVGMYGDLQGIIGASLPEIEQLEIKALPDSDA